jgi:hypothetical protein
MISCATKTHCGFALDNSTDAIAITCDLRTRVINWGFLANLVLHSVTRVTDADWTFSPNSTTPTTAAVNTNAVILELLVTKAKIERAVVIANTGDEKQRN